MRNDYEPIIYDTPKEFNGIELYVIGDIHYGNKLFNENKWNSVKEEILAAPNRYMVFVGDAMENAVPGSKNSIWEQTCTPQQQREWVTDQLTDLRERIVGVVDGNHERGRSTQYAGLYPLFDSCVLAGIEDQYRPHFAFIDIAVGTRKKDPNKQSHYTIYVTHKAKDLKTVSSADYVEGVDLFCYGHDHVSKDQPRGKLIYDSKLKQVRRISVECVGCGSFLDYGGYAADNAYRPGSDKLYKVILNGSSKVMTTVGFYV